jgi:hypothetical protein
MNNLKFLLLNGELSRKRCRSLASHRADFFEYIDSQLKSEKIEPDLGRAIETEIRVNGEKTAWAFLFDYGLKGKTIFGGFEV